MPIRIATPCAADWDAMTPVAGGRHCALCRLDVLDVDRVGEAEVVARIRRGERVCGRRTLRRAVALAATGALLAACGPDPARLAADSAHDGAAAEASTNTTEAADHAARDAALADNTLRTTNAADAHTPRPETFATMGLMIWDE